MDSAIEGDSAASASAFWEGWMRMNAGSKVFELGTHFNCQHRFADQIRYVRSHHAHPKDYLALGVSITLTKPSVAFKRQRRPRARMETSRPSRVTRRPRLHLDNPHRRSPDREDHGWHGDVVEGAGSPAITSAATFPSRAALCASIGSPVTSQRRKCAHQPYVAGHRLE